MLGKLVTIAIIALFIALIIHFFWVVPHTLVGLVKLKVESTYYVNASTMCQVQVLAVEGYFKYGNGSRIYFPFHEPYSPYGGWVCNRSVGEEFYAGVWASGEVVNKPGTREQAVQKGWLEP